MRKVDAIIVGGGPAGSSCARALVQRGFEVALLDKQTFPRNKVCAGWITPAILDELQIQTDDYRHEGRVLQPISAFRTGLVNGPAQSTRYDQTVSYGIRRIEFDEYLLRRSGAELHLGEGLKSCDYTDGHWTVNGRLRAPLLIGAGGHFCPIARQLGARPGRGESAIMAQEAEFRLEAAERASCNVAGDTPELYFCRDLKGYGWAFRKGDYLNIGLGREDAHNLGAQVEAFRQFLVRSGRISESIGARFQGHAYLLYRQQAPRRVLDDGVVLVGDAAGLAYPQSGEGIRPAIESGLMAAEVIAAAGGHYGAQSLSPYARALAERFGEQRQLAESGRAAPLRRWLGQRLLSNGWFTRHVVLDRWFLHRNQAPLQIPSLQAVG